MLGFRVYLFSFSRRHRDGLSLSAVGRCVLTSIRSSIGVKFWDTIEALYGLPLKGMQRCSTGLIDHLWLLLVYCRTQAKMFSQAIAMFDAYLKVR